MPEVNLQEQVHGDGDRPPRRSRFDVSASAMPSLGHTFFVRCTLIPCDRSHSLGRRMTDDLPPRPTELRDVKSPPQRPPVDGSNEYAAFAAQLAARNERRRASEASAAPPPGVDHEEDREEAASRSLSSLLASHPVAAIAGGVLLLVMVSVAVLVFRDRPFQASTPLPSNRIEPATADISAAGKRDVTVPSSVPAPPASPRTVASPPPEPPRAAAPAPAVTTPLPADPPPAAKEPVKATPESPPSASQIPSTSEPRSAPLTPDEIRELQGKLKAAGFDPGAIDGVVGPQTRSALRNYAQSRSLQNAEATRDLLVRLNAEPARNGRHRSPRYRRRRHSGAKQPCARSRSAAGPPTEPTRPEPFRASCAISAFLTAPPKGRSVRRRARRSASSSSPRARPKPVSPARRCSSSSRGSALRLRLERPSAGRGSVRRQGRCCVRSAALAPASRTPKCHPLADATRIAIAYISAVVEEQPGGTSWTNIQSPTRWKRDVDFWRNAVNSPSLHHRR